MFSATNFSNCNSDYPTYHAREIDLSVLRSDEEVGQNIPYQPVNYIIDHIF